MLTLNYYENSIDKYVGAMDHFPIRQTFELGKLITNH